MVLTASRCSLHFGQYHWLSPVRFSGFVKTRIQSSTVISSARWDEEEEAEEEEEEEEEGGTSSFQYSRDKTSQ
jgi:hypothetical protein